MIVYLNPNEKIDTFADYENLEYEPPGLCEAYENGISKLCLLRTDISWDTFEDKIGFNWYLLQRCISLAAEKKPMPWETWLETPWGIEWKNKPVADWFDGFAAIDPLKTTSDYEAVFGIASTAATTATTVAVSGGDINKNLRDRMIKDPISLAGEAISSMSAVASLMPGVYKNYCDAQFDEVLMEKIISFRPDLSREDLEGCDLPRNLDLAKAGCPLDLEEQDSLERWRTADEAAEALEAWQRENNATWWQRVKNFLTREIF
jgi:hypothetical protein